MPLRTVPAKTKIAVYLTQREKTALEVAAKQQQLTLSEWVRALILRHGLSHTADAVPTPVSHTPVPLFDTPDDQ